MSGNRVPWWRGARGEWYVAIQLVLFALLLLGPRTWPGLPAWPASLARVSHIIGIALLLAGGGLSLAGSLWLGSNLTPLPFPKPHATLVQTGPYRIVRHPIYSGIIMLAYGWALQVQGWLTIGYATVLLIFLDIKAAREERWLVEKFADYPDYRRRVRKLLPFLY